MISASPVRNRAGKSMVSSRVSGMASAAGESPAPSGAANCVGVPADTGDTSGAGLVGAQPAEALERLLVGKETAGAVWGPPHATAAPSRTKPRRVACRWALCTTVLRRRLVATPGRSPGLGRSSRLDEAQSRD